MDKETWMLSGTRWPPSSSGDSQAYQALWVPNHPPERQGSQMKAYAACFYYGFRRRQEGKRFTEGDSSPFGDAEKIKPYI